VGTQWALTLGGVLICQAKAPNAKESCGEIPYADAQGALDVVPLAAYEHQRKTITSCPLVKVATQTHTTTPTTPASAPHATHTRASVKQHKRVGRSESDAPPRHTPV
jgi:hypothetical protein